MTTNDAYSALADLSAPFSPPTPGLLSDSELLDAQRHVAEIRRRADAAAASLAAEVAVRSQPDLGYSGLAQRLGARTPEILVQQTTGVSKQEAHALTRVGALLADGSAPWLSGVATSVADGSSSVAVAEAIRVGLGTPDAIVTEASLASAAAVLLEEAAGLTLERLSARARELRSQLDLDRVAEREEFLRQQRYLRVTPRPDGMVRISGLLDPESAAPVVAAFDAATSPRRGGPRFVDDEAKARAERIVADPRTLDQLMADTLVDLVTVATAVDDGTILGSTKPTVHILVTQKELDEGRGAGHLEGSNAPVSLGTVHRNACASGAIPILFRRNQPVDLGRTERCFTPAQRIVISARDGGCIFPGCDRPPSWSEVHHVHEWQHGGRTDVRDGVLLCRHHHMLLHNNGWRCVRGDDVYRFIPPVSLDAAQRPIPAQNRAASARKLAGGA